MLQKQIKELVRKRNICVLATVSADRPYCSLMAYVPDTLCKEIYMVTLKSTTKFKNLQRNPCVSILIDTRETQPRSKAQALTIDGFFTPLTDEKKKENIRASLLEAHPHMEAFMKNPDAEMICIKINSFLLLDGLTESHFVLL